MHPLHCDWS